MPDKLYLSKITLPDGNTYELKDLEARDLIDQIAAGSLTFIRCTGASNTPQGVQWNDGGTVITGTLVASNDTKGKIYLVPQKNGAGKDYFEEYVTVDTSATSTPNLVWEKLGDTEIDFESLGAFAYADTGSGSTTLSTVDSASFGNGAVSASASYTPAGSISVTLGQTATAASLTRADYTPAGTVSKPDVTVTPTTIDIEVKKTAGSVTAGSAASFTRGSFNGGSFTQGTDTWTAPVLTTSVSGETLTIGFSAGSFSQGTDNFTAATHGNDTFVANTPTTVTLPTFEEKTVMTDASAALASTPTFTGTKETGLKVTAASYDKASVSAQSFTGTAATINSTGTATGDVTLTKSSKTINITVNPD